MNVRDAVEADAERLADLTDSPQDVMRNLVHDRTVRVAEKEADDSDGTTESDGGADSDGAAERIAGFVSYDAREDTVHVTQLEGTPAVCDLLLAEPVRFAETEGMAVELLVPEGETATRDAAEDAGFERAGSGPRFEGETTVRYRLTP